MTGETDDTVASPGDEKASLEHLSLRPETANAWQTQGKPKPPPKEEGGEGGDANDREYGKRKTTEIFKWSRTNERPWTTRERRKESITNREEEEEEEALGWAKE